MIIYIAGFLLSIFLFYYADSKRFMGKSTGICVVIGLLIPCLIAGLRDISIGTDARMYVEPLFVCAKTAKSFLEFYQSSIYSLLTYNNEPVASFEIGYLFLTYFTAKIFNSLPVLLFFIQALTVIPVYKGLRAFSNTQPVWLGMVVYYLMFFNQSLNMMRQWIAMAILFQAFPLIVKGQPWRYLIYMAVAMSFHYSAFIGLTVYFTYQLLTRGSTQIKMLKVWFVILLGTLMILSLDKLAALIALFSARYANYISGTITFMPNQLLYRVPILLLFLWRWRYLKQRSQHAEFMLVLVAIDLLASQLTSIYENSGRIACYFNEYYILEYPMLCQSSNYKGNRRVMRWMVIGYLSIYWWYTYVHMGSSETVPYVSIFG